jgi:cobalt-zinc-cadmium efflux system membrane fusion protein
MARGARIRRTRLLGSGLLLLGLMTGGCSGEKQGTTEPGGGATAASPKGKATATAASPSASDKKEPEKGGHEHAEGAAPHDDDASGPVVALTAIERANIGLKTEAAERRPFDDVRRLPGVMKATPDRIAIVTSRTPGKVVAIHAALGQRVTKGTDLIEIQSVEIERLETDLLHAENRLRLAQSDAERARALVEKGIAARKELIAAENQLEGVKNDIEGLIRQLVLLGVPRKAIEQLRRERLVTVLHIPAPIDGTVVERAAVVGQAVEPVTPLLKLVDTSVLIAQGSAPEDLLRELKVGQPVQVTVAAYPGKRFEGRLSFIHPQIDPERRVAHVWAEIRNPEGQLKEDMFAQLSVVVGGGPEALVIPAAALMSEGGLEFVFTETPAGFKRTSVLVGARNDQYVEIKQGLSPGAKVVTDGKRQVYTVFLAARSGAPALGGHTH